MHFETVITGFVIQRTIELINQFVYNKILNFLEVSAVVLNFSGISVRNYRIQAWDFSKGEIPDIKNCKYYRLHFIFKA